MPCYLDEFVAHVAKMLDRGASQAEIDRFLETLLPEYRDEVLDAARERTGERSAIGVNPSGTGTEGADD